MKIQVIYIPTEELCWIPDVAHTDHLQNCECGSDPLGGDGIDD